MTLSLAGVAQAAPALPPSSDGAVPSTRTEASEPEPTEPEPEPTEPTEPEPEPAEVTPAQPSEPTPIEPGPEPHADAPAPAERRTGPADTAGHPGDAPHRPSLPLGLLVAGSGFFGIGTGVAVIYGVTESRCGGSCIGGALTAGLGIAGVVTGAILRSRAKQELALVRGGQVRAAWRPARGVWF